MSMSTFLFPNLISSHQLKDNLPFNKPICYVAFLISTLSLFLLRRALVLPIRPPRRSEDLTALVRLDEIQTAFVVNRASESTYRVPGYSGGKVLVQIAAPSDEYQMKDTKYFKNIFRRSGA